MSLDRGPRNFRPNEGANKPQGTGLDSVGELEQQGNRNSVNFSRPMSPQNSPPHSPLVGGRVRSPPPNKSTELARLPEGEANRILDSIHETTPAPAKKKKKAVANGLTEGSHPTAGSIGTQAQTIRSAGTPQQQPPSLSSTISPNTVTMSTGSNELPRPKKKKKKVLSNSISQDQDLGEGFGSAYPSDTDSVTSERSSTNERPRAYNTRAAGLLMKQPSVVREDREAEEQEENRLPTKKTNGKTAQNGTAGGATPANISKIVSKGAQHSRNGSQVDGSRAAQRASLDVPGVSRQESLSPARSTHFSSQPEYETADGIKHQPPARSVSPAKSALKHSPSRGHSPIGSFPTTRRAGFAASEASDTTSNISDDGSRSAPKKKKGVRVSFDDDSVAVGRVASPPLSPNSPVIMSPQNKPKGRSWFDLVREKKQEEAAIDADQDSVIKPTPTLPSFGSIRRDRNEESALDSAIDQKRSDNWAQDKLHSMDTSSDQVLGGILSQDAAAKQKENSAQPIRPQNPNDPLPPEVTSVEGSGYHSDEDNNLYKGQLGDKTSVDSKYREEPTALASKQDAPSSGLSSEGLQSEERSSTVPSIALQPATPGLDASDQDQKGWLGMPGEFPDAPETSDSGKHRPESAVESSSPEITPATAGLAEPESEAVAAQHDPASPHVGGVAEGLRTQIESHSGDESDETGDSIYSDAAEDHDDLEGDGFGSINAIVESPAPSPVVPVTGRSPPSSPSVKATAAKAPKRGSLIRKESELSEPASEEGWDRAQAYWSGLSQEKRRQLERAAMPGALNERIIPNKTMRGPDSVKSKKKKVPKKNVSPSGDTNPPMPPWPDKQYRNDVTKPAQPGAPSSHSSSRKPQAADAQELPHMRTSMRNSQISGGTQEPHMRSSMREGPPPKSSLRNGSQRNSIQLPAQEPRGALQKKNRPTSAVPMIDYNKPQATSTSGHLRGSSTGAQPPSLTPVMAQPKKKAPAKKPMLHRNDSDSSSSFKKERRTTPAGGKYAMKRTMRASSTDTRGPVDRTSSHSTRNTSPAGSTTRRPFSTVGPGAGGMRMSMRDSVESSRPAARTSRREPIDSKRAKSPSRFGFGKSSKPKAADVKQNSRFSSRFGDSSDEEDSRPIRSSRFADSSDDEPAGLTPVRGIPRRVDEGDSTDLEDSSVENTPNLHKPNVNGIKPSLDTKPEGVALATGSLRVASGDGPTTALGTGLQAKKAAEKDKKKRSFFGSLSSRKRDDPSRVRKADIESPARRDPPLERPKTERMLATGAPKDERVLGPSAPTADPVAQPGRPAINSRTSSAQNSPKSPKLQRRNTPKRLPTASDISWPLPQGSGDAPDSRPRTSDGAAVSNGTGRPDIGARRITVQGAPPPPNAPLVVGKIEKKKRFGMLRKAFGIQN